MTEEGPGHLSLWKLLLYTVSVGSRPRTINSTIPKSIQKFQRSRCTAGNICVSYLQSPAGSSWLYHFLYVLFIKSHHSKLINLVYFHLTPPLPSPSQCHQKGEMDEFYTPDTPDTCLTQVPGDAVFSVDNCCLSDDFSESSLSS